MDDPEWLRADCSATSTSRRRARRWPRTTTTSPTSSTCTAPSRSPTATEIIEGTYKRVKNPGLERETFGLGLGVVRVPGIVTFLSSVTPDRRRQRARPLDLHRAGGHGPGALEQVAEQFASGVTQDIPIWENKIYRPRPVLTKGESGIIAHRNWAAQFYSHPVELPDEI